MRDAQQELRSRGLRVTAPRIAVLQVLSDMPHVSADTVANAVRERTGTVSTQGIYNVVNDLVGAGLVERVDVGSGPALYELAGDSPHHHLMCRSCGYVVDLACDHGASTCLQPPGDLGFADIRPEIVFWGTCSSCAAAQGKEEREEEE